MTIWLVWNDADDESFRARYADLVGEQVQDNPHSKDGMMIVGSSVCSPDQALTLATEFGSVAVYTEFPEWFVVEDQNEFDN